MQHGAAQESIASGYLWHGAARPLLFIVVLGAAGAVAALLAVLVPLLLAQGRRTSPTSPTSAVSASKRATTRASWRSAWPASKVPMSSWRRFRGRAGRHGPRPKSRRRGREAVTVGDTLLVAGRAPG